MMQSFNLLSRNALRLSMRSSLPRSFSSISRTSSLRPTFQTIKKTSYPAFSTSIARREPAGESDQLLAKKLEHERELEIPSGGSVTPSSAITEFQESGLWDIQDNSGSQLVTLKRTFGNETITVEFTVEDFSDGEEDELDQLEEDNALADEAFEQTGKSLSQGDARGGKGEVAAAESMAPADSEDFADAEGQMTAGSAINLNITVTKPGNKGIFIHAIADDGVISPHSLTYYPKADLIRADNREAAAVYTGPPFPNLDAELQNMFDAYLEERGINASLANFISHYVDHKEQREYCDWLQNMKEFIET